MRQTEEQREGRDDSGTGLNLLVPIQPKGNSWATDAEGNLWHNGKLVLKGKASDGKKE